MPLTPVTRFHETSSWITNALEVGLSRIVRPFRSFSPLPNTILTTTEQKDSPCVTLKTRKLIPRCYVVSQSLWQRTLHYCSIEVSVSHHHLTNRISTDCTGDAKVKDSVNVRYIVLRVPPLSPRTFHWPVLKLVPPPMVVMKVQLYNYLPHPLQQSLSLEADSRSSGDITLFTWTCSYSALDLNWAKQTQVIHSPHCFIWTLIKTQSYTTHI